MVLISDIHVPGFDKSLCFGMGLGERASCGEGISVNYTAQLTTQSKDKRLIGQHPIDITNISNILVLSHCGRNCSEN